MPDLDFERAAVIGAGMMGPGIALTLALGGIPSTILSRSEEKAAAAVGQAEAQARMLSENGLVEEQAAIEAVARLRASAQLDETVAAAGLVVESAPESMALKQGLFERLDRVAPPDSVLASNTSGLSISRIAERCRRPERILTTHFWNPPHLMPLVEIVKGERTSDETADAVRRLLERCGKTPVIVKKDRPGQLGNRLQMALVREAVNIIAEGIADAEAIDTVAKNGFGLRMPAYGILEHQDIVGLPLGLAVLEYVARDLYNQPGAPAYFQELVSRGDHGARTGHGFYDWSEMSADGVRARRDAFLIEVLRYRKQGR